MWQNNPLNTEGCITMDVLNSARIIDVGYVPDDCHYWFVRTQGGRLFKEFCKDSYIAVGWNDINIDTIKISRHINHYTML